MASPRFAPEHSLCRRPARTLLKRTYLILSVLLLSSACTLFRNTPTPLPWIPTASPDSDGEPQELTTPTPEPTATASPNTAPPTPSPTATLSPTPTEPVQTLTITAPRDGMQVGNPVTVKGSAAILPFEGELVIRIVDQAGRILAEEPTIAEGPYNGPATFEARVLYGGSPGPARIEVVESSAQDGSVIAKASTTVALQGFPGGGVIESPAPQVEVTLPILLQARAGQPGQDLNVTVTWDDGSQFAHIFTALRGLDDRGLLIVALDQVGPSPLQPPTQPGAVEIHTLEGERLAWQPVCILSPDDPGTMSTSVFWVIGEETVPQRIRIPRTLGIGKASLRLLLWGPVPHNDGGFDTAIPMPEEVLNYAGRGADWGERVRLNSLTIIDGVARADLSPEITANPGGALVTSLIRSQIEKTLLQFSTVDQVEITLDGQQDRLQP